MMEKNIEEIPIIENYGEELNGLFQVSAVRESSKVVQARFSPLSPSQFPLKFFFFDCCLRFSTL